MTRYINPSFVPDPMALEKSAENNRAESRETADSFWPEPAPDDTSLPALMRRIIRRNFLQGKAESGGIVVSTGTHKLSESTKKGATNFSITLVAEEVERLFMLANWPMLSLSPRGSCHDCIHSLDGQERGWDYPCVKCTRPGHDHFQSAGDAEPYKLTEQFK